MDWITGVQFPKGAEIFVFAIASRPAWGIPSLSNGYHGLFLRGQSGLNVKLTSHLRLEPGSSFTPLYAFMAWCIGKGELRLYLMRTSEVIFFS